MSALHPKADIQTDVADHVLVAGSHALNQVADAALLLLSRSGQGIGACSDARPGGAGIGRRGDFAGAGILAVRIALFATGQTLGQGLLLGGCQLALRLD